MIIQKLIITFIFISISNLSFSQSINKFPEYSSDIRFEHFKNNFARPEIVRSPLFTILGITALLINPIVIYENKRVEFGLTKEISFAILPLGRISFEYSRIFRGLSQNHLRFSYDYDFYKVLDIVAYGFSPGVGYFTDTKNGGMSLQFSYGLLIPAYDKLSLAFHPYIKLRYTIVTNNNAHNFADFSIGFGLYFYAGIH